MRSRLTEITDMRLDLAKLPTLMDREFLEAELARFFPSRTGRLAASPLLVAGFPYLHHTYRLSDEAVVFWRIENPYYQHFCVDDFQQRFPVASSSLTRWRERIRGESME